MKVVCVGDSVTYGQGVRADQAWPAVLSRLTGHDVRNEGVCGDTTRLGLERFPMAVQIHSPDCVVLQFGCNDAIYWLTDGGKMPRVSLDAYFANVMEMINRSLVAGASLVVTLQPHTPKGPDRAYNGRVGKYRSVLEEWGVGVSPPRRSFVADGKGIHPDPAMHERYARLVAEALK